MDNQTTKSDNDAKAMPPPPPPPRPVLLEQEIECLKRCLQNATLKTGQVYAFYGDTRRLDIAKYASDPPRALTSSLGRELEKFDQLCDVIENHLLRAIAVLQRDLLREEKKEEATRLEAEAQKQSDQALQETQPVDGFPFAEPAPPEFLPTNPRNSPTNAGGGPMNTRRPSAISISSLQRPTLPSKLDLTSSSLRMVSEEGSGMYSNGLASPVTIAPRSARPVEPDDFPGGFFTNPVDGPMMGLRLAEGDEHQIKTNVDSTAGDSSDKPNELDLDMDMSMSMNDLFGDNLEASGGPNLPSGVESMFTMTSTGTGPENKGTKNSGFIDLTEHDILATLSSNSMNTSRNSDAMTAMEAPSPATLLATSFPQHLHTSNALDNNAGLPGPDQPFDMAGLGALGDLSAFNSTADFSIPDMDAFLNMNPNTSGGGDSHEKAATST